MSLARLFNWKTIALAVAIIALLITALAGAAVQYTSSSEFCGGICHAMTEAYEGWKDSPHHADNSSSGEEASCVECHFLPGEKLSWRGQMRGARHLAAYLYDPEAPLPIRAVVEDGSCLRSGCHAEDEFRDKTIQLTENVRFKHGAHLGEKALPGQRLTCDTCHFKVTEEKHFEVPKEICFLCHLKPWAREADSAGTTDGKLIRVASATSLVFNEGPAKCDFCHEIPAKSLQAQLSADDPDAEAITHDTLTSAGVPCESCHLESVDGSGHVDEGSVHVNGCLTCHNWPPERVAQTSSDDELMHEKHVATRRADCFDCHRVVQHGEMRDYLETVRVACTSCHENQHASQSLLLAGPARGEDIPETPSLMHAVKTNCLGCHTEKVQANGHTLMAASGKSCADCHGEEQAQMAQDWRNTVEEELEFAKELEAEVLQLLVGYRDQASAAELEQAQRELEEAREDMGLVELGNGVHNKKYSMLLLDASISRFEELIDSLRDGG